MALARVLLAHGAKSQPFDLVSDLLADSQAQKLLGINHYEGVIRFQKESYEKVLEWLARTGPIENPAAPLLPVEALRKLGTQSGYRVVKLMELTRKTELASPPDKTTSEKKVAPKVSKPAAKKPS